MKKLFTFCLILTVIFTVGCTKNVEHVQDVSHEIMDNVAIEIPNDSSTLAKAIYEATDMTFNQVVNQYVKKKPEFISFEFSSDVLMSQNEKDTLKKLFSCYNVEITEGRRAELSEIDRGVTIGFGAISRTQTDDCDLTIPVKVYYGRNYYTYCSDFMLVNGEYVLFRFELLNRTPLL